MMEKIVELEEKIQHLAKEIKRINVWSVLEIGRLHSKINVETPLMEEIVKILKGNHIKISMKKNPDGKYTTSSYKQRGRPRKDEE